MGKPNYIWTIPDTLYMVIGEIKAFSNEFEGTGTLSSPDSELQYRDADVSATYLSGTATVSNRIMTSETFTPTIPGAFVLLWEVVDGGNTRFCKTKIVVSKKGTY